MNYKPESSCFESVMFHMSSKNRLRVHSIRVKSPSLEKYIPRASSSKNTRNGVNVGAEETADKSINRRPYSSASYVGKRDHIYTTNHPNCVPPQMYLHEDIRQISSNKNTQRRRVKSADTVHRFGSVIQLPKYVQNSEHLKDSNLSVGEKQYLWGIARCYSIKNLRESRQKAVHNLLQREFTRIHNCRDLERQERIRLNKEFEEYSNKLNKLMNDCSISSKKNARNRLQEKNYSNAEPVGKSKNKTPIKAYRPSMQNSTKNTIPSYKQCNRNTKTIYTGTREKQDESLLEILCDEQDGNKQKTERPKSAKFRNKPLAQCEEVDHRDHTVSNDDPDIDLTVI